MKHGNIVVQVLKYLWSEHNSKLKFALIFSIIFLIASRLINVFTPLLFKHVLDGITVQDLSLPVLIVVAYGCARTITQLFNELKEALFAMVEQESVRRLALSVFNHLHSLSLRFHLDRKTGVITRSIERGAKALETAMRFSMFNIIPTAFEIVIVSIALYVMYPAVYMVITLLTLFSYGAYTIVITEWRSKQIRRMKNAENQSSFKAIESLINYETVKYFTNEEHEISKYNELLQRYKSITISNRHSLSLLNIGQSVIISLGLTGILVTAYHAVQVSLMTVGDFVLVNMYLIQLYQPLSNLGFSYREIKLALVEMEHMFGLLNEKQDIKDKEYAKDLVVDDTTLSFDQVDFHYQSARQILSNISFQVPSGRTLAIVGPSGSGKSTITRLIFRFYEVNSGQVSVGGHDVKDFTQKSLRQLIGVVPQDTVLFNDTLRYNISYGNITANEDDIKAAAKVAEIHDFIMSLPDDYDTVVGERGLKLSGGEKQRIAIARTVLKNPKIFVFDEATSSLDTRTEFAIQESINKIAENHTTIIIAHRLSTVVHASEIIVLDAGKIVERGNHPLLIIHYGYLLKLLFWMLVK